LISIIDHISTEAFLLIFFIVSFLWVDSQADIDDNHFERFQFFGAHGDRLWSRILVGILVALFDPILGIALGLHFWAQFDLNLNIRRELPWYYIGGQANTDKKFRKALPFYYTTKILAVILYILIILGIITFYN